MKKSKGYAIEFLLETLGRSGELDSLDAIVIVDADTTIDRDLLRAFDDALRQDNDWLQAYYTVANPDQSWRTRLMTYAFSMFNGVMQLGQNALGGSAGLKGNGRCFSTRGLRRRPWSLTDWWRIWNTRGRCESPARRFSSYPRCRSMVRCSLRAESTPPINAGGGSSVADIRKKYLGPLLSSPDLGPTEKVLSICELTIPSMATLALIYLVVAGLDDKRPS